MANNSFKDNRKQVFSQMDKNKAKALEMIGLKWQEIATKEATAQGVVDTGRYRASLSYVTPDTQSGLNSQAPRAADSQDSDALSGRSGADTVKVGTNVNYGPWIEEGTSRMAARPVIGNSVQNYREDYKEIVTKVLGEGFDVN